MSYVSAGIATNSDVMIGDNATVNEDECDLDGNDVHLCIDGQEEHHRLYLTIDVGVLKRLMAVADRLITEWEVSHKTTPSIRLPE